jgi:hypothetical protein
MQRHRGWRATANGILVLFLALIFVALSPVIIFVVLPIIQRIYRKRLEAVAGAFACLSCGGLLGHASLRLADAAWREHVRDLLAKYHRIRLVRHVHAICPACGARYMFVEHEKTFVPAPTDRAFRPATTDA